MGWDIEYHHLQDHWFQNLLLLILRSTCMLSRNSAVKVNALLEVFPACYVLPSFRPSGLKYPLVLQDLIMNTPL